MHLVITLRDIGTLICLGFLVIVGTIIFLLDKWDKRK